MAEELIREAVEEEVVKEDPLKSLKNAEIRIISERITAMQYAEKIVVARCIPTRILLEEIERRNNVSTSLLSNVLEILSTLRDGMELEELQEVIASLKSAMK